MQLPTQVALVDDDDLYRETVAADLADRGFAVSGFADGRSLLDALHNGLEAQVVLLDWALPEGSGLDVLNTLRQGGLQVPVVFLTGVSLAERELQAFNYGAVDFIDKLRGVDVLVQRLRLVVEGQRKLPPEAAPEPLHYGNLTLLPGTARAQWCLQDVGLDPHRVQDRGLPGFSRRRARELPRDLRRGSLFRVCRGNWRARLSDQRTLAHETDPGKVPVR